MKIQFMVTDRVAGSNLMKLDSRLMYCRCRWVDGCSVMLPIRHNLQVFIPSTILSPSASPVA